MPGKHDSLDRILAEHRQWQRAQRPSRRRQPGLAVRAALWTADRLLRLAIGLFFRGLLPPRGARRMLGASHGLQRLSLRLLDRDSALRPPAIRAGGRRSGGKAMRGGLLEMLREAPLLWAGMAALAGAIFVADTLTDLEIAVAVLHVAVVLLSARTGRAAAVMLVGGACAGLTILSFFLTRHGAPAAGLANCAISLLAIGATTGLAIRIGSAAEATRQAEARLAHMARLTTMGELAASIAHEVNQPLAGIAAHGHAALRWLAATPPDRDEARRSLERIVEDAGRAGEVIARVRGLVRRAPPSRDRVDLGAVIAETIAIVRGEVRRHHVLLRTEIDAELPAVRGDRIQLQQVVLNLLVNAVEAVGAAEGEPRDLQVGAATDGRTVTVSVRDCGIGLAPAALDRMFEAFYTTKPAGMGMGLAISRSIIEAHGGTVYAAPNFPRGTVFGFVLPLRPEG